MGIYRQRGTGRSACVPGQKLSGPSGRARCIVTSLALVLAACGSNARTGNADPPPNPALLTAGTEPEDHEVRKIDPSELRLSFVEEFNAPFSVSPWGCITDWIAHTPWRGDFGDAVFADPVPGFPFTVEDGALVIEARRGENGRWASGMLSGRDVCNSGWSQFYGYFEIRAKLPGEPGFWPAFWLVGVNRGENGTAEIDVFEYHTSKPDGFTAGLIKHPGLIDVTKRVDGIRHAVEPGRLSREYNTFGVEIDPIETVFYFNREAFYATKTPAEFRQPFFMLVSFPAITSAMTPNTPDSVKMYVDYIRVYQRFPDP